MLSLVTSAQIPIKSRALRGVILGTGYASSETWLEDAVRVVLPGLRVVGKGKEPAMKNLMVLASAEGWWVAQKT